MNLQPPYYAVIFTASRSENVKGYQELSEKLFNIAQTQSGFLGIESAGEDFEITVSYSKDLESISAWKENPDYIVAQTLASRAWYKNYKVRISKVEREY